MNGVDVFWDLRLLFLTKPVAPLPLTFCSWSRVLHGSKKLQAASNDWLHTMMSAGLLPPPRRRCSVSGLRLSRTYLGSAHCEGLPSCACLCHLQVSQLLKWLARRQRRRGDALQRSAAQPDQLLLPSLSSEASSRASQPSDATRLPGAGGGAWPRLTTSDQQSGRPGSLVCPR